MELTSEIESNVSTALAEDMGDGDLTALLTPENLRVRASIVCREPAVICGQAWAEQCFLKLDPAAQITWLAAEGTHAESGAVISNIEGKARALLSAERTALNFLQTLSAVATLTRQFVNAVAGTGTAIVDTRKTLPGLRLAQKYAVKTGGGTNHRLGLYDAVLIKENHIAAAGGIRPAMKRALGIAQHGAWIQIEVENLQQLAEALAAEAEMILLDNMELEQMREAVRITAGRAKLEASGGITLENVRAIADTGVDRISIGALTKDIKAVDLSMRFE